MNILRTIKAKQLWSTIPLLTVSLLPSTANAWTGCYFSDNKYSIELNAEKGKCGNFAYENISKTQIRLMARTSTAIPLGSDVLASKEKRAAAFVALPGEERFILDCFSDQDQPILCTDVLAIICVANIACPPEKDINSFGSLQLSPSLRAGTRQVPVETGTPSAKESAPKK